MIVTMPKTLLSELILYLCFRLIPWSWSLVRIAFQLLKNILIDRLNRKNDRRAFLGVVVSPTFSRDFFCFGKSISLLTLLIEARSDFMT